MISSSLLELLEPVVDGTRLAIPATRSGVAMKATVELARRKVKNLHLVAIPTAGLQADILIGAGCVSIVESAGITLDEQGQAPQFVNAVKTGSIRVMDTTCPAIISALQAGEKGIPFIPMRGLIGSDLLRYRPDYQVIDNPMSDTEDPIVLLPAIVPDIALFHAPLADRFGNVWVGKSRELMTMAHASRKTLVTVENFFDGNLMEDPIRSPATIPAHYITSVARAENGAWPLGLEGHYPIDETAMESYANANIPKENVLEFLEQGSIVASPVAAE